MMADNPYSAPNTVSERATVETTDPAIAGKIKNACLGGVIFAGIMLWAGIVALVHRHNVLGLDAWALLDSAIILGLTYGVYRKSRVCALLLCASFIAFKIVMLKATGDVGAIIPALLFLYLLAQGVDGTFQYHERKVPPNPALRWSVQQRPLAPLSSPR